jgi:hypothetical protein
MREPSAVGIPDAGQDSVSIESIQGAKPAVEILIHGGGANDGQVGGKSLVQDGDPLRDGHRRLRIEVADLPPRVRSAIGATRSGDLNFLARD